MFYGNTLSYVSAVFFFVNIFNLLFYAEGVLDLIDIPSRIGLF